LLSPIVGGFADESLGMGFVPPFAEKLLQLAHAFSLPAPAQCEMHVGSDDWQCDPEKVAALGSLMGVPVTEVSGAGHLLGVRYVQQVLDRWLG